MVDFAKQNRISALTKKFTTSCLAIDTETTGVEPKKGDRPYCVTMCDGPNVWYFVAKVDPFTRKVTWAKSDIEKIKKIIAKYKLLIFWNAKFDTQMLRTIGIDLANREDDCHDGALADHALDSREDFGRHRLKPCAKKYLGISEEDQKELQSRTISARNVGKQKGWALSEDVPADYWMVHLAFPKDKSLENYATIDAERTYWLWVKVYAPALAKDDLFAQYEKQRSVIWPISRMENRGISLLPKKLAAEIKRLTQMRDKSVADCLKLLPKGLCDNLNSGKQLQAVLYDHFKLPILYRTDPSSRFPDGQPSTDKETIKELTGKARKGSKSFKFLDAYAIQAAADTAVTYLNGYDKKKITYENNKVTRIFPSFNIGGTATLRLSASNPNPQNVGKGKDLELDDGTKKVEFKLRVVFGPGDGRIWYANDYDQLQLRIFAQASGEKRMVKAFADGFDFHTWMACEIFGVRPEEVTKLQRRIAKNVNFGYIFGAGPNKIEATSGMKGLSSKLAKMFPNVADFMKSTIASARETGYVYTLGGYRLSIEKQRAYAGVCIIVQGTEGEIVKNAMNRVDKRLQQYGDDFYMSMQVHDELVFDASLKTKAQHLNILRGVKQDMEAAGAEVGVKVIANCEVNKVNWAEPEKVAL